MEEQEFLAQPEGNAEKTAFRYLLELIMKKHESSSVDWQPGKTGNRSIKIQEEMYQQIPQSDFTKAAKKLEQKGLIRIQWAAVGFDVGKVIYRVEKMPEIYRLCGKTPKTERMEELQAFIRSFLDTVKGQWLKDYGSELLERLEQGSIPAELKEDFELRESLFRCLAALDELDEPMYYRIFSSRYLGDSKVFENRLKTRVIAIARHYHPDVDDSMGDDQILGRLHLDQYTQEMAIKGALTILLDGKEIDLADFSYGIVLNAETLKHALPGRRQRFRTVITVENKANFVSMPYEEGTLLVFSHGFFSPLEQEFLRKLRLVMEETGEKVRYFHTGDLDYGGIRIFQHIRANIFPELQPWQMDVEQYERFLPRAVKMKDNSWKKLKNLKDPVLQPLIDRILEEHKVIEQENFL